VREIELKESDGKWIKYDYCDIWWLKDGKMEEFT